MKTIKTIFSFTLVFSSLSVIAEEIDVESLMLENCTSCHTDSIYQSDKRKVHNLYELEKRLHQCNHAVGTNWDLKTMDAVMKHLNQQYYHFKEQ